jgi:hypothetical protein
MHLGGECECSYRRTFCTRVTAEDTYTCSRPFKPILHTTFSIGDGVTHLCGSRHVMAWKSNKKLHFVKVKLTEKVVGVLR